MPDVKEAFSRAAGEDVTYMRHRVEGHVLRVDFAIAGQRDREFTRLVNLRSTSNLELEAKARVAGTLAGQRAFRETGKYDQQMRRLREGRLS